MLRQVVSEAVIQVLTPGARLGNRLVEKFCDPYPRVLHNGAQGGLGGPTVKLNRMQRYFPNDPFDYNIIYSVSARIPAHVCRQAQARGCKVVCHVNSVFHPAYRADYAERNAPIAEVYAMADYVVYGSRYAQAGVERYLGQVPVPHSIVYNAVDTSYFRPPEARAQDRFNVLAVGIHYIRHRLEPLIRAMPYVQNVYPQARLIIAGPLQKGEGIFDCGLGSMQAVADEVGLGNVDWLGSYTQKEAPLIYARGDVLVHLKHMDWTPNTVIEAMACGLPIVHTGNGGMDELVGSAGVSLNVPFDWDQIHTPDPSYVAECIIEAYKRRLDLGTMARQIAVERYEMQAWVEAHRQIFASLLRP
ncbi:MAG: glycosyltransferase family 4 protein [Thermoflexales bacterium]|nr:glycosyltransferase family 4 protein [Thermoflexales bacterium]